MKTTLVFAVAVLLAATLPAWAQQPYGRPYDMAPPPIADQYHSYEQNIPDPYRRGYLERQDEQRAQQERQKQEQERQEPLGLQKHCTPFPCD